MTEEEVGRVRTVKRPKTNYFINWGLLWNASTFPLLRPSVTSGLFEEPSRTRVPEKPSENWILFPFDSHGNSRHILSHFYFNWLWLLFLSWVSRCSFPASWTSSVKAQMLGGDKVIQVKGIVTRILNLFWKVGEVFGNLWVILSSFKNRT